MLAINKEVTLKYVAMMVVVLITALTFLFLGMHLNVDSNKIIQNQSGDVLFLDENPDVLNTSKIIKVVFKEELPNSIIFDVTYYFHEVDENLKVSVWPNMKHWSFSVGKRKPGLNTVTIKSILSSDNHSVYTSDILTFSISSGESKYNNWDDQVVIPYKKIWLSCEDGDACHAVFETLTKENKLDIFKKLLNKVNG